MKPAMWLDTKRRHYAVIKVRGEAKICCFMEDEWIVDNHCKYLNDLIKTDKLSINQVRGWLLENHSIKH